MQIKTVEVLPKPFPPQKIVLAKPSTAFRPATLPEYLYGRNPERKTHLPFSRKNSPPPNQKCKECFFFRGCRRVREAVTGRFVERTIQVRATTRSARSSFWVLLEISPNFFV